MSWNYTDVYVAACGEPFSTYAEGKRHEQDCHACYLERHPDEVMSRPEERTLERERVKMNRKIRKAVKKEFKLAGLDHRYPNPIEEVAQLIEDHLSACDVGCFIQKWSGIIGQPLEITCTELAERIYHRLETSNGY